MDSKATAQPSRTRPDWWFYILAALVLLQPALFIVPVLRPGVLGMVCWLVGADPCIWWGLSLLLFIGAMSWSFIRPPFLNYWRVTGMALIILLALSPLIYRVYPSSHDEKPSEIAFRVPLDGEITVAWGGTTPGVNYHVRSPDQKWAYDLLITMDGKSYAGDGKQLEDYFIYGKPVFAPAHGVVHATYTDAREMPVGMLGGTPAGGNQIVIKVADKQYLFLCHLKPGSLQVKASDNVTKGQQLALVGNTGNTSEPHLHIHLQDTPKLHVGEGIPLYFHHYRVGQKTVERGIPTGGFQRGKFAGQIIQHID